MPTCNVSVILPTYNRPSLLRRALLSAARQTCLPREIIVVDDSSDAPVAPDLVGKDLGVPVRVIRHDVNCGAAAARNTGIRAATAEYVAFLDNDDEWLPKKLERQMAFLRAAEDSSNHPIACTTGFVLNRNGVRNKRVPKDHRSTIDIIWGCSLSPGSTMICRRALFDVFGEFDERLRRMEDWDWHLRFIGDGKVVVIPEILSNIYISTHTGLDKMHDSGKLIREKFTGQTGLRGWLMTRRLSSSLMLEYGAMYHHEHKLSRAIFFFLASLALWPFQRSGLFIRGFQLFRTRRSGGK